MALASTTTWRMLSRQGDYEKLPEGLDALWDRGLGLARRICPHTKRYLTQAGEILRLEKQFSTLTDAKLRQQTREMCDLLRLGRDEQQDRYRAMAMVREVAWRQLGLKPFAVQVAGALAICDGCVAEMATGEGKTLTATMPATMHGWRGLGCHVLTVNDYLAQRDAQLLEPVYKFCGLSVAYINQQMDPTERRNAYAADITYATNKEVTADFLRDRMTLGRIKNLSAALLEKITDAQLNRTDRLVQRGLNFAIVDEADSVLIDEGVTPLIISGSAPNDQQVEAFKQAADIAGQLAEPTDYRIDYKYREVDLTNSGYEKLARLTKNLGGVWSGLRRAEELVVQALIARELYLCDKQYVVQDGKVVIVDDFTGRLMPDRQWRDGLHQAVSAKENLEVEPPKDTYARVSFQRFFRMYRRLSGMTGTGLESAGEFWQIYHLPVVVIPTNKPCIRTQLADQVYLTEADKFNAIVARIKSVHKRGQPILVGTRSVKASEKLSALLAAENFEHQVLNAVRHREEAQIVSRAGQPGKITVATNMAGRGTDIKLGRGMDELGGLCVIASERHESHRIDRQLYGRSGRQGDPGEAQAFVSLEDELPTRYASSLTKMLKAKLPSTTKAISSKWTKRLFTFAQRRAQRLSLRQRRGVLRTDDWLDEYLGFAGTE